MRQILMTLAAVLCYGMTLYAQPLTEQQAMERALQYMNSSMSSAKARRMAASPSGRNMKLKAMPVEAEKIYAFNMEGGGFVIASGDQRTLPVLGYSPTGRIDWEQMPENMRSWLKQYDEAIATLGNRMDFRDGEQTATPSYGQGTTTAQPSRRAERKPVEPLIKTHWDQSAPYWDQVPTYQGPEPNLRNKQCYVGCVATAMAQVMNYWQWPNTVPYGLPDYDYFIGYNDQEYTWHLGALPPTRFEWELMINDYNVFNTETQKYDPLGTDEQRKAVATLMRYCGQSIEMMYGPAEKGGSSAYYCNVPMALTNYYNYSAAQFIEHIFFPSIDEWEEVLYGELAAGRPVVYGGNTDSSGHCFVCDGYDGEGLFHINWGWSGEGDAYFALAVLNPYNNTSAGSGSSGIGFCIHENATIYTDPKMDPQPSRNGESVGRIYQRSSCKYDDINLSAYYSYFGTDNETADLAFGTIDAEGQLHPLFMSDEENNAVIPYHDCNDQSFTVKIDSTMFTAGQTIDLYPMVRFRHPGEEWQVIPPLEQNVTVGCNAEGRFFMHPNQKNYDMQLTGVRISKGTGRLGERSDLTIHVRNNESSDYIHELYLLPIYLGHIEQEDYHNADLLAQGSLLSCGAYIPAHGEADVTFSFVPQYGGTVVFCAYADTLFFGELPLELDNDILTDYSDYIENNSYLACDGEQWFYKVVLTDRIGATMPHWIPSENLRLRLFQNFNGETLKTVDVDASLKEYLAALPGNIGNGNFTFTCQMPVEVSNPGVYQFETYIAEVVGDEQVSSCCDKSDSFIVEDLTGIQSPSTENASSANSKWYDLQGRQLLGKPTSSGIYMQKVGSQPAQKISVIR